MRLSVRQKEKSVDGWEVVEEGGERAMGSWDAIQYMMGHLTVSDANSDFICQEQIFFFCVKLERRGLVSDFVWNKRGSLLNTEG